jgi:hypothetical protein
MENPGLCGLQVNVPCQSFPPTNPPNGSGVFPPESTPSQTPAAVAGEDHNKYIYIYSHKNSHFLPVWELLAVVMNSLKGLGHG